MDVIYELTLVAVAAQSRDSIDYFTGASGAMARPTSVRRVVSSGVNVRVERFAIPRAPNAWPLPRTGTTSALSMPDAFAPGRAEPLASVCRLHTVTGSLR